MTMGGDAKQSAMMWRQGLAKESDVIGCKGLNDIGFGNGIIVLSFFLLLYNLSRPTTCIWDISFTNHLILTN